MFFRCGIVSTTKHEQTFGKGNKMANFFKDYQKEVKERKEKEEQIKREELRNKKEYKKGQVVYISPIYDENYNGKKYFADTLTNGYLLLADTKKEALNGVGHIYHNSVIRGK